ncbi:MAG: hypothetical protein HDS94_00270 [Bacteroidales bacterium]|nr:hypothetical protein [Bacteroidales bacterium]
MIYNKRQFNMKVFNGLAEKGKALFVLWFDYFPMSTSG